MRKDRRIFADETGKFVCATAGPTLETIMAAHGRGGAAEPRAGTDSAQYRCRRRHDQNKRDRAGQIRATTAVNIGARLVAHNGADEIVRLEKGGTALSCDLGENLDYGAKAPVELRTRLANRMAQELFDAVTASAQPWDDFYVTAPLGELPEIDGILFSGGVSEYIYARESCCFRRSSVRIWGARFAAKRKAEGLIFSKPVKAFAPPSSALRNTRCS